MLTRNYCICFYIRLRALYLHHCTACLQQQLFPPPLLLLLLRVPFHFSHTVHVMRHNDRPMRLTRCITAEWTAASAWTTPSWSSTIAPSIIVDVLISTSKHFDGRAHAAAKVSVPFARLLQIAECKDESQKQCMLHDLLHPAAESKDESERMEDDVDDESAPLPPLHLYLCQSPLYSNPQPQCRLDTAAIDQLFASTVEQSNRDETEPTASAAASPTVTFASAPSQSSQRFYCCSTRCY